MEAALPQGAGYAVVVGLGAVFAGAMIATTWVMKKTSKTLMTSEEFSTAGRHISTGLTCSSICSSWTWSGTLLESATRGYITGVSGPFFYAAGGTPQIILFGYLALKIKQKAPECHTYLELFKTRYGSFVHWVFIIFGLITNILVTVVLLTGGCAAITSLTGMNIVACIFLLPLGVMLYTLFGGLKATFLTDYVHTIVIIVIILVFGFTVFCTSNEIGSSNKLWELVTEAADRHPVSGNAQGSYLTMKSHPAGIFFIISSTLSFGTVFLDNGYWK